MTIREMAAALDKAVTFDDVFKHCYLEHVTERGNYHCPFHDDTNASFGRKNGRGRCFAGCKPKSGRFDDFSKYDLWMECYSVGYVAAVKKMYQHFVGAIPEDGKGSGYRKSQKPEAIYKYFDAAGTLVHETVRFPDPKRGKRICQRRPDGGDGYIWDLDGIQPQLYRLLELMAADPSEPVILPEGEKCVDAVRERLGMVSTCNPMGGGQFSVVCDKDGIPPEVLHDRDIILPEDNDDPGRKHTTGMARACHGYARSIKILDLRKTWPEIPEKGDVYDLIEHLGPDEAKKALLELAAKTPIWEPPAEPEQPPGDVEKIREKVVSLRGAMKADASVVMEPENIGTLAALQVADSAEWIRFKQSELKPRGLIRDIEKAIRKSKLSVVNDDAEHGTTVSQACRTVGIDVPEGCDDLLMPGTFSFTRGKGVAMLVMGAEGPEAVEVNSRYLLVTKRLKDVASGLESVNIGHHHSDRWNMVTVPRATLGDPKALTLTGNEGFPVGHHDAKLTARFLHEFLVGNDAEMPSEQLTSALGWLPGNRFLAGLEYLTADGDDSDPIRFNSSDAGDQQVIDSISSAGSLTEWQEVIRPLEDHPKAVTVLYGALAAPLLKILQTFNIILDLSSRTSVGKTTVCRVAASAWGCPDVNAPTSFIRSWDMTQVSLERRATLLNDLPVILDDSKRGRAKQIEGLIYLTANGIGRGRGTKKGLAHTGSWRTVMISNGESPLTSYSDSGGAKARVISIKGLPFGRADEQTKGLVDSLNLGTKLNYGHAGPAFVRWLIAHSDRWPEFRERYRARVKQYLGAHCSGEGARVADYAATISVSGELSCEAGILPWNFVDPFQSLWKGILDDIREIDRPTAAMRDIYSWAWSNQAAFYGNGTATTPGREMFGFWDPDAWESIDVFPTILNRQLVSLQHEPEAIRSEWLARGWLNASPDGTGTIRRRIGKNRPRLVSIKKAAIEDADHEEEMEPETTADGLPLTSCDSCPDHHDGWCGLAQNYVIDTLSCPRGR